MPHFLVGMSASSSSHGWSRDKPAWLQRYEEKVDVGARVAQQTVEDSGDDDDMSLLTPLDASQRLYDLLVKLKERGSLSAKDVCTIAFFRENCEGRWCDL